MAKYKCTICKEEFNDNSSDPVCPVCGAKGDKLVKIG